MRRLIGAAAAGVVGAIGFAVPVGASTVYQDISLVAGDFNGSGLPIDSVTGNTFTNNFSGGVSSTNQGAGPALGGPSSSSSLFVSPQGYYGTPSGSNLPTNNFDLSIYARASNITQSTDLVSSNGGNKGELQLGITGGNYVAYLDSGSANNTGALIGSIAATTANTHLEVTDYNGVFTFLVNGIPLGSVTPSGSDSFGGTDEFSGFGAEHLGVQPGGGSGFSGDLADLTISVPEPSMFAPAVLAAAVLLLNRRRIARA